MEELNFKPKQEQEPSEHEKNIQEVFRMHPELETIGDQKAYAKYLETIFPESQIRDIVWHGSSQKINQFEDGHSKRGGVGIWFNPFLQPKRLYQDDRFIEPHGPHDIPAILNIINPLMLPTGEVVGTVDGIEFSTMGFNLAELKNRGYDSLVNSALTPFQKGEIRKNPKLYKFYETIVFNPSQIHVLGSTSDLENFKKFVESQSA